MKKTFLFKAVALAIAACMLMTSCSLLGNKGNDTETSCTAPVPGTSVPATSEPMTDAPGGDTSGAPADPMSDIALALGSTAVTLKQYEGFLDYMWASVSTAFSMFGILSEDDLQEGKTIDEIPFPELFAEMFDLEAGATMMDYIRQLADEALKSILISAEAARTEGMTPDQEEIDKALEEIEKLAKENGYEDLDALLKNMFGEDTTTEDLRSLLEIVYLANQFESSFDGHEFTADEISEFMNSEENIGTYFTSNVYTVIRGVHATRLREMLSEDAGDDAAIIASHLEALNGDGVSTVSQPDFTDPEILLFLELNPQPGSYVFGTENGEDCFVILSGEEHRDSKALTFDAIYTEFDPSDIIEDLKALSVEEAQEYIKDIIRAEDGDSDVNDDISEDEDVTTEPMEDDAPEEPSEGDVPEEPSEGDDSTDVPEEPVYAKPRAQEFERYPDWTMPSFSGWLASDERQPGDIAVRKIADMYTTVYFINSSSSFASVLMLPYYIENEMAKLRESAEFVEGDGINDIKIPALSSVIGLLSLLEGEGLGD